METSCSPANEAFTKTVATKTYSSAISTTDAPDATNATYAQSCCAATFGSIIEASATRRSHFFTICRESTGT